MSDPEKQMGLTGNAELSPTKVTLVTWIGIHEGHLSTEFSIPSWIRAPLEEEINYKNWSAKKMVEYQFCVIDMEKPKRAIKPKSLTKV